ncbi:MAG TPA: glycosyltransferase [Syntrophales bacterium]|nr:glycosyltransferase [Syntrophales bacterium]HOD97291.1 glycosyltransferase [Syntrophales bacterium]HOH72035.1 glycosyltransferase [Syntrophales bacterium]HPN07786.1 glycosyltransferase [Syntrophales bacterium]HPX80286.1 glycosyltransferase [Syntrophales bacterium]
MKNKKMLMISTDYYGIERSIARAFARNGFEPVFINARMDSLERLLSKFSRVFPKTKRICNPFIRAALQKENRQYISKARIHSPAFAFIVKGDAVFPETLRYLRGELGIPCLSYQWDNPFPTYIGTAGGNDYRDVNFRNSLNDYDHIFIFDDHYTEELREKGGKKVSYLPLAADDELFQHLDMSEDERAKWSFDVCFVGMPYDNRIEILNALSGFHLGVFGDYWERYRDKMVGDYYRGKASGETVRKIYGASKIVLNINHPQSRHGVNARTFEIPCCGAFEIVNHVHGLEDLFAVGKEIVCYKSEEELKSLVTYYLAHDEEREAIVAKGHQRVMREHTWFNRVKDVIELAG